MEYPRYIAVYKEGRFAGQYPQNVSMIPSLKRMCDQGKLGTGRKLTELESVSVTDLLKQLRSAGISPTHDDVDFYKIQGEGSQRQKLAFWQLNQELKANG